MAKFRELDFHYANERRHCNMMVNTLPGCIRIDLSFLTASLVLGHADADWLVDAILSIRDPSKPRNDQKNSLGVDSEATLQEIDLLRDLRKAMETLELMLDVSKTSSDGWKERALRAEEDRASLQKKLAEIRKLTALPAQ